MTKTKSNATECGIWNDNDTGCRRNGTIYLTHTELPQSLVIKIHLA